MVDKKTFLSFCIECVEEEHGELTSLDTKVVDTGMDSFGITMVLTDIDQTYSYSNGVDGISGLDITTITFKDIYKLVGKKNGTN